MKISCFGASVTQQKKGYCHSLEYLFNVKINNFGYGSEHIFPSGITHINEVLKSEPDLCFIDWFSTGYETLGDEVLITLDTIKYKFSKANCKLIFLFFPRNDHDNRINFYNFIKKYLIKNDLYFIDLNDYLKYNTEIIRDHVHTTLLGAQEYSKFIYYNFDKDFDKIKIPDNIIENKYCNVKELEINKKFLKKVKFFGNCYILSFDLNIGPNSGYIRIDNLRNDLLWDNSCHYNRKCAKLNKIKVDGELELYVLQRQIDYSNCRRDYDFSNINFELDIIKIYYIGDNLNFIKGN